MIFTLQRFSSNEFGTFGFLSYFLAPFGDNPLCFTLEDVWNDNKQDISCIPAGTYICKRVKSPTFGDTFQICNVVGREFILFHWGNTEADTKGCLLTGSSIAYEKGLAVGVESSKLAFGRFMEITKGINEFTLIVKN